MSEELDDAMQKVLTVRLALYIARTRLMRDPEFVRAMTGPDMPKDAWVKFYLYVGQAEGICDRYEEAIKGAGGGFPIIAVIARTSILDGVLTGGAINIYNGLVVLALDKFFGSEPDPLGAVKEVDAQLGLVLQDLRDTLPAHLAASFKVGDMIDYRVIASQALSKALDGESRTLAGELEGILGVPGRLQGAFATSFAYKLVTELMGPNRPGCNDFRNELEQLNRRVNGGALQKGSYRYSLTVRNFWEAAIRYALCHLGRVRNPPGGPTPA